MTNNAASEERKVIERMFEALGKGDMPAVIDLLSDDVHWVVPGDPEIMPWAGSFEGKEQVIQSLQNNTGSTKDIKITPEWIVSEGEKVLALINEQATVAFSGEKYDVNSLHVYTVHDGKITAFENYFNPLPVLKATYGEPSFPGLPKVKTPGPSKEIWVFFDPEGQYHHVETFLYEYDENGNKKRGELNNPLRDLTYVMEYHYNDRGEGTGEKWVNSKDQTDTFLLNYEYEPDRNLLAGGKGVGSVEWDFSYTYDIWGRKVAMDNVYSNGMSWNFKFTYDESGKMVYGQGKASSGLTCKITYEYEEEA